MKAFLFFLADSFRDKLGRTSGRELTVFVFVCAALAAWIGDQFLGFAVKEHIFYCLMAVIMAGLGLYTFERPAAPMSFNSVIVKQPLHTEQVSTETIPPIMVEPQPAFVPQNQQPSMPQVNSSPPVRPGGFPTPNRYPR